MSMRHKTHRQAQMSSVRNPRKLAGSSTHGSLHNEPTFVDLNATHSQTSEGLPHMYRASVPRAPTRRLRQGRGAKDSDYFWQEGTVSPNEYTNVKGYTKTRRRPGYAGGGLPDELQNEEADIMSPYRKNMLRWMDRLKPTPGGETVFSRGGYADKRFFGGHLTRALVTQHIDPMELGAPLLNFMNQAPFAEGGHADGDWIQHAIKKPGALHRQLGIPQGQKIPAKVLRKATHSSNPTLRKRAELAETLKGFHK